MFKILNSTQIRQLDQYTIDHEPISSIQLMERACKAFVEWFVVEVPTDKKIGIVCGTGNNGGDGLGIARMLNDWNYNVTVWIVRGEAKETDDFKTNFNLLIGKLEMVDISAATDQNLFGKCDVLIDAIFGTGLSRPVEGIYKQVIQCINKTDAEIISVDVPSGLLIDQPSTGEIVRADQVVTFQLPKLAFLLPENFPWLGAWHTVDIGLNKKFIEEAVTSYFLLTKKDIKKVLRPRKRFDHKGTYGHALIVAGSFGKMGAAILAARAALRSGVGLLTIHSPKCGYSILQTSVPEAMISVDQHELMLSQVAESELTKTIGIGPGIGQHAVSVEALSHLLEKVRNPIVLDADALNILAANKALMKSIPKGSILTPHPKELERLIGSWKNDFEKLDLLKQFASSIQSIVVLKGAYSAITTPDQKIYFNPTGNPGMATGGSGDVLTGILTGLLAQGYDSLEAAMLGVYLHGLAGDLAARDLDINAMIASDIIDHLPSAFRFISR